MISGVFGGSSPVVHVYILETKFFHCVLIKGVRRVACSFLVINVKNANSRLLVESNGIGFSSGFTICLGKRLSLFSEINRFSTSEFASYRKDRMLPAHLLLGIPILRQYSPHPAARE